MSVKYADKGLQSVKDNVSGVTEYSVNKVV